MRAARHNPKVPGISPTLAHAVPPRDAAWEELHTALEIILAAAANLRHYRERLTPEDHTATVRDIEQAAEQISAGLALEKLATPANTTGGKRRTR
jgi:hypothetical protein